MIEFSNTLGSSYLHMFKMYVLVQIRGLLLTEFFVDRTCFVHLCCTSQESEEQLAQVQHVCVEGSHRKVMRAEGCDKKIVSKVSQA
jgi:hypothetical protein